MNHKTIKYLFLTLIFSLNLTSCQNDFITSKIILEENEEIVFYDVFQTGIDNYTIKFNYINSNDTINLFEYYLNDAVFGTGVFDVYKANDTLYVKTLYPAETLFNKTKNGLNILLINKTNFSF